MPGIQEIATKAGVSPATVSRALRGLQHVNERTRAKIVEAAQALGYPIDAPLKNDGRTHTVGVISPFTSRWYFSQAIAGAEQALREAGLDILLYNFTQLSGRERIFQNQSMRDRVDALIVISLPPTEEEFQSMLALDIPIALIGIHRPEVSSVTIDDVAGARTATQHLVNQGHKVIGLISGEPTSPWGFPVPSDRRDGFLAVLKENGLKFNPNHEVHADFTSHTAERAMDDLLARADRPTAIFCASDEMAFGAMISIRNHGLRVPEDISIVGFDGHEMAGFAELTTIAQPVHMLGEMAAWSILEKMKKADTPPKTLTLPTTLVVRKSTQKIN
jgi:DNA-binding LacI/PurR family transcriptional regulator